MQECNLRTSIISMYTGHPLTWAISLDYGYQREVFGDAAYKLNISSTKSMTGHMLGAAGAVGAMSCVLAIRDGIIPPTINHDEDDRIRILITT